MHKPYKNVKELVNTNPLLILKMDKKFQKIANNLLPYETGIEIECGMIGFEYAFKAVQTLALVDFSINLHEEQRFRLKPGVEGMCQLWHISEILNQCASPNPDSGIHYHVDFREHFSFLSGRNMCINGKWILKTLESWKYTGEYNNKQLCMTKNSWVRVHPECKTLEFRIGEMTFDYKILIKRILHAQKITEKFANNISSI